MKCNSCNTSMLLDRSETSNRATTTWHRCPCCKKVRLTSELDKATHFYATSQHPSETRAANRLNRFTKPVRHVPA